MDNSGHSPLVGTFDASVSAGDKNFSVVAEFKNPVAGIDGIERAIEGLAGDTLRKIVHNPSEAVFVDAIKNVPPGQPIEEPLDTPIEIPGWLPGVKILSIRLR